MIEYCFGFVEDAPSAAVARKLIDYRNEASESELQFVSGSPVVKGGIGNIRKNVQSYVKLASSGQRIFLLVDLDELECAPTLLREWFSIPRRARVKLPERLIFRVCVREIEAWIMADRSNLATFFGISVDNFPRAPERLKDPKQSLLNIIRRKGRKAWHRGLLPSGPTASIGPTYNEAMCRFVEERWDPESAANNSSSLKRAIAALMDV